MRVYCSKLPQAAVVKNLPTPGDARDTGSIPGLGRSPGVGDGNPLQCSCLDNAMDRGTWRATVHGVAKSQTQLSTHTHTHTQSKCSVAGKRRKVCKKKIQVFRVRFCHFLKAA